MCCYISPDPLPSPPPAACCPARRAPPATRFSQPTACPASHSCLSRLLPHASQLLPTLTIPGTLTSYLLSPHPLPVARPRPLRCACSTAQCPCATGSLIPAAARAALAPTESAARLQCPCPSGVGIKESAGSRHCPSKRENRLMPLANNKLDYLIMPP